MNPTGVVLDPQEVAKYISYQKSIFFSKADGAYPIGMELPQHEKYAGELKKLWKTKFGEDDIEVHEYPRRTLHYVYKVKDSKKTSVVRINASNEFYREFQFFAEAWALSKLKDAGLPHIQVNEVDVSRSVVPFDYEITDEAVGDTLYDFAMTAGDNPDLFRKLGEMVAHIHETKTNGFGPVHPESIASNKPRGLHETWQTYLFLNLDTHIEMCETLQAISRDEAAKISELLKGLTEVGVSDPVLLHGDLANHNAFTDGEKITALIDWEDAISGDPLYDVAYYGSSCFGKEHWQLSFLEGYKSVRPVDREFPRRYWLYYLRIALMKVIVRQRFGSRDDRTADDVRNRILLGISKLTEPGT